jgi:hypothetical protein
VASGLESHVRHRAAERVRRVNTADDPEVHEDRVVARRKDLPAQSASPLPGEAIEEFLIEQLEVELPTY